MLLTTVGGCADFQAANFSEEGKQTPSVAKPPLIFIAAARNRSRDYIRAGLVVLATNPAKKGEKPFLDITLVIYIYHVRDFQRSRCFLSWVGCCESNNTGPSEEGERNPF